MIAWSFTNRMRHQSQNPKVQSQCPYANPNYQKFAPLFPLFRPPSLTFCRASKPSPFYNMNCSADNHANLCIRSVHQLSSSRLLPTPPSSTLNRPLSQDEQHRISFSSPIPMMTSTTTARTTHSCTRSFLLRVIDEALLIAATFDDEDDNGDDNDDN
jgi:hypothetical protein